MLRNVIWWNAKNWFQEWIFCEPKFTDPPLARKEPKPFGYNFEPNYWLHAKILYFLGSKDYQDYDPDDLVGTRCIHCAMTSCPDGQTLQNGDCYDLVTLDEVEPLRTSEPAPTSKPVRPSEPVRGSKPDETPRILSSASILGLETRIIWTTVFVQVMIFLQLLWTVISKYVHIIYLLIAQCDDWNMDSIFLRIWRLI